MKIINVLSFLCLCCFFTVNGQHNTIVIGKIDSISSTILNEQRELLIHIPESGSEAVDEKQKYPVIYLLDGGTNFHSVVGMIKQLSSVNSVIPKMIVVGIPNTIRTRDLTPTKVNEVATSGGGGNFISFIEKELIPYIESKYPTGPYRMFIGHSFGGLTVMNTLIEKPELFNSYVAIDPWMSWDDKKLLQKIKLKTFDKKYSQKKLFLGIANTMDNDMDTLRVKKDTTFATRHIRSVLELNAILKKETQNQLSFKAKYYEEDDHFSLALITEYDALRYIFDFYQLKLENQDYMNPDSDILDRIVNHYNRLSKEFGIEIKPDQKNMNSLGHQFIRMQQFKKAQHFFELNVKNYPESSHVYDSMGDMYVAIGKKEMAIENYKKSLSLHKDSLSKDKLKELQKE